MEFYNIVTDIAQKENIAKDHQEKISQLKKVYDKWWNDVLPHMINDNHKNIPAEHKPFHDRYREAFGEEAFQKAISEMDWGGGKKFKGTKSKKQKQQSTHK